MTRATPPANTAADHVTLLRGFVHRPLQVAYLLPSSRFLVERVVRAAAPQRARVVVELGPGTGGTTRALLRALPDDARLLAIELNGRFVRHLHRTVRDPRLVVHRGHAAELPVLLRAHDLAPPDVVVSGIPFANLSDEHGRRVLTAVRSSLADGGRFVAYQMRDNVERLARPLFGRPEVSAELRNVPPMRVYRWCVEAAEAINGTARGRP